MISRDILINWFFKNELELIKEMMKADHNVNIETPNIYHMEGTIWTHTLMVMTYIESQKQYLKVQDYIKLITTALLHDIGKPSTLETLPASETKSTRNSFKGHEGVSTFMSIKILKKLQKDFPEIYTENIIKDIIYLVSLHGCYIDKDTELKEIRDIFRMADKTGAVRKPDADIIDNYPERNYVKQVKSNNKHLIMLCGLPASGKSTITNNYKDYYILSRDNSMFRFIADNKYDSLISYNEIYHYIHNDEKILNEFNDYFEKEITNTRKTKDKVLVDMTMLSLSSRRKMLSKFSDFKCDCLLIITDNETLMKRQVKRSLEGKYISDKVYFDMMRSFVMPVKEEGFNNIEIIIN